MLELDEEGSIVDSSSSSDSSSMDNIDPTAIICFKWDFKRMKALFKNKDHGRIFENNIYSLWLKSVSEYILRQSNEIYEYKVKKQELKETIRRSSVLSPSALESDKQIILPSSSSSASSSDEVALSYSNRRNIQAAQDGSQSITPGKYYYSYRP